MFDVYGGTLRLQVRAVFADAQTGMVLTSEHGSYQGEDLAYTSVHVFSFDDAGFVRRVPRIARRPIRRVLGSARQACLKGPSGHVTASRSTTLLGGLRHQPKSAW